MKKIVWITPDSFVDCDNNPEILSNILNEYSIHWIIILPSKGARFKESDFEKLKKLPGLTIEFFYEKYRARDPRMLFFFEKLYKYIKKTKNDLVYFNYVPTTPYVLPLYWRLNKQKTIFTAHDGNVKPTFKMPIISKFTFNLSFNTIKYVNVFSKSQALLFLKSFPHVKYFLIPLALKDFGLSTTAKRSDCVSFLFFGTIHNGKNLELLIDASCSLYEDGLRGFKISINGSCNNWEKYQDKLKYPELFDLDIRSIDNNEIPNLFASNHYMVLPYNEMSQSGALKIAFRYNIPVLVSSLEGFKEEVKDNVNGYIFETENLISLKRIISICVKKNNDEYIQLCENMKNYTRKRYSYEVIAKKYIEMFNYLTM